VLVAVELSGRLGIPQATAKLVAQVHERERAFERTSVTLTAIVSGSLAAAFVAAAPALARWYGLEDGARFFRLAAIDIPFYGMYVCLQHVLNGRRRFGTEGLGVSLYGAAKALGVLSLLWVGVTVERALWVNALASVLGCAYFALRLSPALLRPTLSEARSILRLAAPIALFFLGTQLLQNIDLWCLTWVGGVAGETIGQYVAATNLARLPSVAQFVMLAVLVPTVSRAWSLGDREATSRIVRGAARFLVLTLLPGCAFLAARSKELMELVFSRDYAEGATLQAILVARYGLLGVFWMTHCGVLIALDETRVAAAGVLWLVPAGAFATALSSATAGAEGAAWAALATSVAGAAFSGWAVRRRIGALLDLGTVARATLVAIALAGALSLWSPSPPWVVVELLVALPGVATLAVAVGAVSLDELRALARPRS